MFTKYLVHFRLLNYLSITNNKENFESKSLNGQNTDTNFDKRL